MTAVLDTDEGTTWPSGEPEATAAGEPADRGRPNVSGDLPTIFRAAPMFRRVVGGYDRFQVDTYVQWAEDELATADRERERLLGHHLRTQAALEEARELLSHSPGGGEFLQSSRRMGALLAAAADEADSMRAAAQADRSAAATEAERLLAGAATEAERLLAAAATAAEEVTAEAATEAERMVTQARRVVEDAERAGAEARTEAAARLEKVRLIEQRAAEHVERIRQQAAEEAVAARSQVRDEIVRMLGTGREERRRADDEADAARQRLDQEALARRAALLADVATLEQRREALRADVELLAARLAGPAGGRVNLHLRRLFELFRWRPRSLRPR